MTFGYAGRTVIAALIMLAVTACETPVHFKGSGKSAAPPPAKKAETPKKEPVEKAPPPTIKQVQKPKKKPTPKDSVQTAERPPSPIAGPPKSSGPDTKTLVGKNEAELRRFLGPPKNVRNEPPAMVWSYQARECSLDVFLYYDVGQKRFRSLAYRFFPETRVTQVERECLAEIQSTRPTTNQPK